MVALHSPTPAQRVNENMISERQKAKQYGLKHYFTGLPCKNGHIDKRQTSDGTCMACSREKEARWKLLNKEKYLERKVISNAKRKDANKLYEKQWRLNNQEKRNAIEANRRSIKIKRTPAWADKQEISMWYEAAEILSRGGVNFHVDHIVPLQGKEVCGFHSQDNLQILPWFKNLQKSNKLKEKNT